MTRARSLALVLLLVLSALSVQADWFDTYEEGLKAAQGENWAVVVQKMTQCIAQKPEENAKARTYGTNFIPYHPYYYRGVAYFNLGEYDKAVADLKKAKGVGKVSLGSAEAKLAQAEAKLAGPIQVTQTQPPTNTTPLTQTQPAVDPGLAPARDAAQAAIARAQQRMQSAQSARANTLAASDFGTAQQTLLDAQRRAAGAETTMEWKQVESAANKAAGLFDVSMQVAQMQQNTQQTTTEKAVAEIVKPTRDEIRNAVSNYFNGKFQVAANQFNRLSQKDKENPLIWQFLGAANYYLYVIEGQSDQNALKAAQFAFRQAKRLNPRGSLNAKYFSPRIVKFYRDVK